MALYERNRTRASERERAQILGNTLFVANKRLIEILHIWIVPVHFLTEGANSEHGYPPKTQALVEHPLRALEFTVRVPHAKAVVILPAGKPIRRGIERLRFNTTDQALQTIRLYKLM